MNLGGAVQTITREELFELARQLVSIPSGPEEGTTEIVDFLSTYLTQEGLIAEKQYVGGDKHWNLLCGLPLSLDPPRLLLTGHLDTVPDTDLGPRVGIVHKRLYGRGSADMKGSIASMVMALVSLHRAGVPLRHKVLFAGVAGEEIGGLGTKAFLEKGGRAEMAIVGEPTGLRLVTAHKGIEWIKIVFEGRSAHASCPEEGVNAIYYAAKLVQMLEQRAKRLNMEKRHPLLGSPTLNVGTIRGGVAPNVVPDRCEIMIDRRWLPSETIEEIYAEIKNLSTQIVEDNSYVRVSISRMEETNHCVPLETPVDHQLVFTIQAVLADAGLPPEPHGAPYGTDAPLFATYGIPTVVWGPGDIRQAHSKDEYIDLDQLWEATRLYINTIVKLCGP